jgi:hypothetical protein
MLVAYAKTTDLFIGKMEVELSSSSAIRRIYLVDRNSLSNLPAPSHPDLAPLSAGQD